MNLLDHASYPTYAVFTNADPTIAVFGLCTRKWGIFALVRDPPQSHKIHVLLYFAESGQIYILNKTEHTVILQYQIIEKRALSSFAIQHC